MKIKRVGDLLAVGLALISIWILTILTTKFITFGFYAGLIGASITLVVEGYYLIKWLKK